MIFGYKALEEGLIWRIGNGKAASFWKDKWLEDAPLASCVVRPPWFVRRLHLSPFPPDDIPAQPRERDQDSLLREKGGKRPTLRRPRGTAEKEAS